MLISRLDGSSSSSAIATPGSDVRDLFRLWSKSSAGKKEAESRGVPSALCGTPFAATPSRAQGHVRRPSVCRSLRFELNPRRSPVADQRCARIHERSPRGAPNPSPSPRTRPPLTPLISFVRGCDHERLCADRGRREPDPSDAAPPRKPQAFPSSAKPWAPLAHPSSFAPRPRSRADRPTTAATPTRSSSASRSTAGSTSSRATS